MSDVGKALEAASENLMDQYAASQDWDDAKEVIENLNVAALVLAFLRAMPDAYRMTEEEANWKIRGTCRDDRESCYWVPSNLAAAIEKETAP